ncbi:unnamed protein product [Ceutorhynchus assimilis]|uniref:Uncharacterized protein n=1 Tax=Ceutorhynchus assimilis TaxID=467358 RepID=A0A9P0DL90_9CUCU|nr:unnamed protein product [Ceutorhynchus assimilis]
MIIYLGALIFATASMVVAFILVTQGNFHNFTEKAPKITELPIITASGEIVNSVEDLDMQLDFLENQLEEKEKDLEATKSRQECAAKKLEKLSDTATHVKKFYIKLKTEATKSETEINELRSQIDDFKKRQLRLKEEVNENVKYYTGMLNNIDATDEYEVVKKSAIIEEEQQ